MIIQENFSLKNHHTFHFNVFAKYFVAPKSQEQLIEIINDRIVEKKDMLILGEGSNILFTGDYQGLVIKPIIDDIKIIESNNHKVWVEVGAGVQWDAFVSWAVSNNFYGIENLSLIPGNVGACPVQNIGAYGIEVKDVITHVNGIFIDSGNPFSLKNKDCNFSYRNSIFKNEHKGNFIITSVCFELSKEENYHLNYGDVNAKVEELGGVNLKNIRKAIIEIRESKLPDHNLFGNVGSFFKNPIVDKIIADNIKNEYPEAPVYPVSETQSKVAAGWMIDQCNWKGKSLGNAAVHDKQALVLINKTGNASGEEILKLASKIEESVFNKFGVQIEKEVNVI